MHEYVIPRSIPIAESSSSPAILIYDKNTTHFISIVTKRDVDAKKQLSLFFFFHFLIGTVCVWVSGRINMVLYVVSLGTIPTSYKSVKNYLPLTL